MTSQSTTQDTAPDEKVPTPPTAPLRSPPPPDGGLIAWLQVAAGFVLFFNTWGMINTFAMFQTYYESGALFQASSSNKHPHPLPRQRHPHLLHLLLPIQPPLHLPLPILLHGRDLQHRLLLRPHRS
ncbi:uncharacterized protein BO80DRAFT_450783 [Aspergillus ibericus CBS 121593]|uniref:MFS general substrate transporter n=1 Tax=Aspergillus ibericus CBS 121593 TaxID=1448316 RepID=A0A395GI07_9EURO|nr:hypothetical protein BO80DRAFT_450783 [Aspergillus ibericus CBS 121593]RAK94796.1 hypothetical protein BO80DRAFT_450783 [Aspergillus ibericus CBS 121593]